MCLFSYTNQNHANFIPSEHSAIGETLGDARTQTYDNGADSLLFSGRGASSTRFPFISRSEQLNASGAQPSGEPSHLVGHSLLDAMAEVGGYSTSGSPTAARPSPLGYYAIRVNATIEATRLASHLDSVLDHYLQRIAEGTTLVCFFLHRCTRISLSSDRVGPWHTNHRNRCSLVCFVCGDSSKKCVSMYMERKLLSC